jgi:hypothetical protein
MQGYLLRPDYFEKVNGMLDDDTKPTATTTKKSRVCVVPRFNDAEQLQAWAIAKGLPEAEIGMSSTEYYQLLCNVLERR